MFGYVQIRKAECKIKDYEKYKSYYCGLCRVLNERFGTLGRVTLSYDMTFLVILLDSLYSGDHRIERRRCIMHPGKKHKEVSCAATEYAADMNMLLTYAKFADDLVDDKDAKSAAALRLYRKNFLKVKAKYPYQYRGITKALKKLEGIEKNDHEGFKVKKAAAAFGELMTALFSYRRTAEPFLHELKGLAYHLGCFIYICDAYDDIEDDIKKESYNPLKSLYNGKDFEEKAYELMYDEAAKCAWYYEKLPCTEHKDILSNIIYAGIWNRYDRKQDKKNKDPEQSEGSCKKGDSYERCL
ncbi:MAG: DUF5685 family protein [Lachnospiraceae bacterium]|nr:DUF5685 family protein [Lachnospiraceae bacterium]